LNSGQSGIDFFVSLQGSLHSLSIPDLLSILQQQKKTGLLSLVSRQDEKGIVFREGDVVFATSRDGSRRLGNFLVGLGVLNEEDLLRSAGTRDWGANYMGQELLDSGQIKPEDLHRAIRRQVLDILDEVLMWEEGAFHFDDWFEADAYPVPASPLIGTRNLLLDAIRRYDECQLIRTSFPDLKAILRSTCANAAVLEAAGLESAGLEVLALVDGARTVGQILRDSIRSPYETSSVLADLSHKGLVQPVSALRPLQDFPQIPEPWAFPVSRDIPGRIQWFIRQRAPGSQEVLAQEIGRDPALTAKALQQFSLSRRTLPREKFTIGSIVESLGEFRTRVILIPEVIRGTYFMGKDFYWQDCCEESRRCALYSREIAGWVGYPYPEEAHLAGLLANLGILILIGAFPERYREVLEEAREARRDLCELEEAAFGISHPTIGGVYAERWKFPKPVIQVLKHHHQDRERPSPLLDLVALAGWAAREGKPGLDTTAAEESQVEGALKRFRLKRKKVLSLLDEHPVETVPVI